MFLLIGLVLAVIVVNIFTTAISYAPGGEIPGWVIPKILSKEKRQMRC